MIFNQVFNSQNLIRRLPLLIPPPLFFSLDIDMCDEKRKKKKRRKNGEARFLYSLLAQTRLKFLWCLFSEREIFFENTLHELLESEFLSPNVDHGFVLEGVEFNCNFLLNNFISVLQFILILLSNFMSYINQSIVGFLLYLKFIEIE